MRTMKPKFFICLLLIVHFVNIANAQDYPRNPFLRIKQWFWNIWSRFVSTFCEDANIKMRIDKLIHDEHQLDNTLGVLFSGMEFNCTADQVNGCYAAHLGENQWLHIFDESIPFKNVAFHYYKAFPTKPISLESLTNLLISTHELIKRCIDPIYERPSVRYGFTVLSDMSREYVGKMLGALGPIPIVCENCELPENSAKSNSKSNTKPNTQCQVDCYGKVPKSWDWRDHSVVTRVKFQMDCASDWIFAAVGAIESSLLVNHKTLRTNETLNLSEQQLVDCAKSDVCNEGGNSEIVFGFVMTYGIAEEKVYSQMAKPVTCPSPRGDYYYPIRDYCVLSPYPFSHGVQVDRLTDLDIQRALIQFGPLYIVLNSNAKIFQNYRDGVIDDPDCTDQAVNHAVLLVGYTPDAWILKNSWSERWGEMGFFRVVRGKNMCGINTEVAWPLL